VLSVIVMVMSLMVTIVLGEMGLRFIDGFQPFRLALVPRALPGRPLMPPSPGDAYPGIPLAPSVYEAWFALDPSPISRQPEDGEVATRQAWYPGDSHLAYWEWNRRYLRSLACGLGLWRKLSRARSVYLFDSSRDSVYPRFRHVAGITVPEGGMVLNAFGWRGAEIPITKGVGVLRIAFLGASTTLGSPRYAWSYPEHVGAWLNTWARQTGKAITFEIANTGRFGAKSVDIVGIAEEEVPAFAPDILVYYEGHNDFQPSFLRCPAGIAQSRERFAFRQGHWLESYSAIARRLMTVISGVRAPGIGEPARPDCRLRFPRVSTRQTPRPMNLGNPAGCRRWSAISIESRP
jgi:hypothetical protein